MENPPPKPPPRLEAVPLRHELVGRLRNISKLKHWQMAVAEAIQNAMDAIIDSKRSGSISVEIVRLKDLAAGSSAEKPITTIIVRDNGVGFDEENFRSFCTPDSLKKHQRGGKGLGRLACLQAFKKLRVRSVYKNGAGWKERKLIFQCDAPELVANETLSEATDFSTEVHLENLRPEFDSVASVSFDRLAEWLSEHFLAALVERPKWLQALKLIEGGTTLDLMRVIEGESQWTAKFKIRGYDFSAFCYSTSAEDKKDMIRLVAGGRIVNSNTQPMDFYLSHLSAISPATAHIVLIYSSFFDEHVNDARNGVAFAEEGDTGLLQITAPEFREACANAFKVHLGDNLKQSVEKFRERITNIVAKEAPYYRPLLMGFFESKDFSRLNTGSGDEDILSALDSYKRRDSFKLKQESRRLARLKSEGDDYWESARKLADQIETQKKVALAEYVSLRKIVLERLEFLLDAKENGNAHHESDIHNLIFPQRVDSESNPGIDHQLWILDERLESHNYLASDQPMDGKVGDRPDLLIALDHPGAFAFEPLSQTRGYQRMVLVEFKQALKDLATAPTDDLPHQQMLRYARQILDDKAEHLGSRRPIKVAVDARFYMYAICELSPALLKRLRTEAGFTLSPTGDGAFSVTNEGRYYIEYISLPKLLEDAKARNIAFFKRLGIEA